jgi:hypothetical protein
MLFRLRDNHLQLLPLNEHFIILHLRKLHKNVLFLKYEKRI